MKEVGASGEGNGVADRTFQAGGMSGEEGEGLGDGGRGGVVEQKDERLDGCDGHGQEGIIAEEIVVGLHNVKRMGVIGVSGGCGRVP